MSGSRSPSLTQEITIDPARGITGIFANLDGYFKNLGFIQGDPEFFGEGVMKPFYYPDTPSPEIKFQLLTEARYPGVTHSLKSNGG